jgi:hypothetical protein
MSRISARLFNDGAAIVVVAPDGTSGISKVANVPGRP